MRTDKEFFIFAALLSLALLVTFERTCQAATKGLLVGVETYQDTRYNLPGVKDDVMLVKQVLTDKCGFLDSDIRTLVDSQATKRSIMSNFEDWLITGTRPGDLALFYFSGHGIRVWDETGRKIQDGMEEAIMPHDANVLKGQTRRTFKGRVGSAYERTATVDAIRGEEIRGLLGRLKDRTIVFISDSCHSGTVYKSIDGRIALSKNFELPVSFKGIVDDRRSEPIEKAITREQKSFSSDLSGLGAKVAAFTACENSQVAQVVAFQKPPTGNHSVFTWYLYQALSGKADRDNSGKITYGQLAGFIENEVSRDGFRQIPQHEFEPEDLGNAVFKVRPMHKEERIERPPTLKSHIVANDGITASEVRKIEILLGNNVPEIQWVRDRKDASVLVLVEKRGGLYSAQMSDPSGSIWEAQQANSIDGVAGVMSGNLKAYYIQSSVAALNNYRATLAFNFDCEVKGASPRAQGEVVKGDAIMLRLTANSPGYPYIFSVDTSGVIHPLYPMPRSKPQVLQVGKAITVGDGDSFTVQEPLGRDSIFAFLFKDNPQSLSPFWEKDDIGSPKDPGITEQRQFLDTIWKELVTSGIPKGDWASRVVVLRSFGR